MFEPYCRKLWQNMFREASRKVGLSPSAIVLDDQTLTVQVVSDREGMVQLLYLTEALYNNMLHRRRANVIRCILKAIAIQGVDCILAVCLVPHMSKLVAVGISVLPYIFFTMFELWRSECEGKAFRLSMRATVQALCLTIRQRQSLADTEWQLLLKLLPMLGRALCYSLSCALVPHLRADEAKNRQGDGLARMLSVMLPSLFRKLSKFSGDKERLRYHPDFVLAALHRVGEGHGMSEELYSVLKRLARVFKGEEIGEEAERLLAEWSRERLKAEEATNLVRATNPPPSDAEQGILLRGHVGGVDDTVPSELLRAYGEAESQGEP
jgi:hypothetical protein